MKTVWIAVARWLTVGAVVAWILSAQMQAPVSTARSEDVWNAVSAQTDLTPMREANHQMIKRLYGLDPSAFAFCGLYYPETNMGAEELLLVRLRDGQDDREIIEQIEKRLSAQKASFEGYGAEQTDLLVNHAVQESCGGFVLFAVSPAADDILRAFRTAVKGG